MNKPTVKLLFYNKCTCCAAPINYPYQLCNDCITQKVKFSGIVELKKIQKKEEQK